MKKLSDKEKFLELRIDGESLRGAAARLKIAPSTALRWDKEFSAQINEAQQARIERLYTACGVRKEARLTRIAANLEAIGTALKSVDFTAIPPERLLELQLKYMGAAKREYTPLSGITLTGDGSPAEAYSALTDLLLRVRAGDTTEAQAKSELAVLDTLLKAREALETEKRLSAIEEALTEREKA